MLCKLSFRNIRRSLRDYTIYFFTLVIGVSVFYVFNAIGSQAAMMAVNSGTSAAIGSSAMSSSRISVILKRSVFFKRSSLNLKRFCFCGSFAAFGRRVAVCRRLRRVLMRQAINEDYQPRKQQRDYHRNKIEP